MSRFLPARLARSLVAATAVFTMLAAACGVAAPPFSNQLESRSLGGGVATTGATASFPAVSADGRYVAFLSNAQNYLAVRNGKNNVFVKDRLTGVVELISRSAEGVPGDGDSFRCLISADGRYVAFQSQAANLVPDDTNGRLDIFVHDRTTGAMERVSVNSEEAQGEGNHDCYGCDYLAMSPDGRYVVFHSGQTNLVPGDTNEHFDVFLRDRQLGITERVSVSSSGEEADYYSGGFGFSVSADGRYVAFPSQASNLVPSDKNVGSDIFVRDRQLQTTELISVAPGGGPGDNSSYSASISGDGRYVAFDSSAWNLVPGAAKHADGIYVRDRQEGTTTRVDLDPNGEFGEQQSMAPVLSLDGRYVLFTSYAPNLVEGDSNHVADLFLRDRVEGITERASVASGGAQGTGASGFGYYSLSPDARYVAFASDADDLVAGDANGRRDVFVRDRVAELTDRVSVGNPGAGIAGAASSHAVVSREGRFIAFISDADNLVAGDTNRAADVFVVDTSTGTTERVSVTDDELEANGASGVSSFNRDTYIRPAITPDGRYVAFQSLATNLVPGDTNGREDYFVRDRTLGTTERVNLTSQGEQLISGLQTEGAPAISADGRYVAFEAGAPNLDPGQPLLPGVFVRDRRLDQTERVSLGNRGVRPNHVAWRPTMSDDGRFVTFETFATNLTPGDLDGQPEIYVRDRRTRTTERVFAPYPGAPPGPSLCYRGQISGDGRYVAYTSWTTNLVPGDANGSDDVFVRDLQLNKTEQVSLHADGSQYPASGYNPSISRDGRFVSFVSFSSLDGDDTHFPGGVFVRDRHTKTVVRASAELSSESEPFDYTHLTEMVPAISPEGEAVIFNTRVGIVASDDNGTNDIYSSRLGPPVPDSPRIIQVRAKPGEIAVHWRHSGRHTTAYFIERKINDGEWVWRGTVSAPAITHIDQQITPGAKHSYRISAINGRGMSHPSNIGSVTLAGVPEAPAKLTAAPEGDAIRLTWEDRSDFERGYSLERREANTLFMVVRSLPRNSTTFLDRRRVPGVQYFYRVRATHPKGRSDYSNEASATVAP